MWRQALRGFPAELALFDALAAAYPNGLTLQELAKQTGQRGKSRAFKEGIQALVNDHCVAENNGFEVRLNETLGGDA